MAQTELVLKMQLLLWYAKQRRLRLEFLGILKMGQTRIYLKITDVVLVRNRGMMIS